MWFFAALVVVVMGGVAALAAGRGAPMADAYDDRPDALVPREGDLGAEDLRAVRFSLAVRGYRMSEVDALLDRLARQLEQVQHVQQVQQVPQVQQVEQRDRTRPADPPPVGRSEAAHDGGAVPASGEARDDGPEPEVRGDGTAR